MSLNIYLNSDSDNFEGVKKMALATKNDFEYVTDSGCLSLKIHVKDKEEKERAKSASCQSPYIGLVELHQHGE